MDISLQNIEAYDKTAKEYDEFARRYDLAREYRKFNEYVNQESANIIDVGCGAGRDVKELTNFGHQVTGIDMSENMLELAKIKAPKATFKQMDFRKLEFDDETFDGFWANATLFMVSETDLEEAILELQRVIKKGSVGFMSFKEGEGMRVNEMDQGLQKRQKLYAYTEIRDLLKKLGFRILLTERSEDQSRKGLYWLKYYVRKT